MIAAGGNLALQLVQVLVFTEEEMPSSKVLKGLIISKVRGLSPDGGGLNPHSESYGCVVLARKEIGIETEMIREYVERVSEKFTDTIHEHLGFPDTSNVPAFCKAVLSSDGGVPQRPNFVLPC